MLLVFASQVVATCRSMTTLLYYCAHTHAVTVVSAHNTARTLGIVRTLGFVELMLHQKLAPIHS